MFLVSCNGSGMSDSAYPVALLFITIFRVLDSGDEFLG